MKNELLVVGDRVLILPDEGEEMTGSGLYLPQGVREKEKIQAGTVVKTGPGYPVPDPSALEAEPWAAQELGQKYFPLQAQEGDKCVFLRASAIEMEYDGKKYVVVPHSSILVLLRRSIQ